MVQKLFEKLDNKNLIVCIVGVGYVGYPLAEAFSKHIQVLGYDISKKRVEELQENSTPQLSFTNDETKIKEADVIIICVPTPVKKSKEPDLGPVISASTLVGKNLNKGSVVVLESTYYPGVTEDIVVPIIEENSGYICGEDFWVGYSPERINPGDEKHTIETITKIVSGMNKETLELLTKLYGLITTVHPVSNIKTAEAAKVIENIQRDLNIALMNELAIIMHKLELDSYEVFEAAATKWNFQRYTPGLVGGHCIPVDPYYLVYKAKELGYHPQVILAGRSINDNMPKYIVEIVIKGLIDSEKLVKGSRILILGLTYKENVPDTRESPSFEIIQLLKEYGIEVYASDPYLLDEEITRWGAYPYHNGQEVDCVVVAVKHREYSDFSSKDIQKITSNNPVIIDVKGIFKDQPEIKSQSYYFRL